MKILIIEDDKDLCEFLKDSFEAESHTVDIEHNGHSGSYAARTNEYDVIILDYSLPKKNGAIVCNEIRQAKKATPIIFLTVVNELMTKVDVLDKGADDYITKPFSFVELRARITAVTRRPRKIQTHILTVGDLVLDAEKQQVNRGKRGIYLTRKEFSLLEYLMKNEGIVLSRGTIMEHVWNADSDPFSNTIEAHILNLRKKINADDQKDMITNIPGRGYVIKAV